jgi:hypothetical protein
MNYSDNNTAQQRVKLYLIEDQPNLFCHQKFHWRKLQLDEIFKLRVYLTPANRSAEARNAKMDLPMHIHSPPSIFRKTITSFLRGNRRSFDWQFLERETLSHKLLYQHRPYLKLGLLRGLADQHCFTSSLKPCTQED